MNPDNNFTFMDACARGKLARGKYGWFTSGLLELLYADGSPQKLNYLKTLAL